MKIAICYLSCDRPELVEQTLPPLIVGAIENKYHLYVADGSVTGLGQKTVFDVGYPTATIRSNVRGGAGAAIVYALTLMLRHEENYDYLGLCEADVLLDPAWFDSCLDLFRLGMEDGLCVGAVSARCYVDRVLFQRDRYAVCHNLGAGHVIFTRAAAEIVLREFRTAWTADNRRIFAQLAGIDIGTFWAFRTNDHYLTADWHWDACLAAHGYASLAQTPSPVQMVGQNPPLAEQGLKIVDDTDDMYDPREKEFARYKENLSAIRDGKLSLGVETQFHFDPNTSTRTYFPHQMKMLGGSYGGDWCLKEARGWGTFAWEASEYQFVEIGLKRGEGLVTEQQHATLCVPGLGPCSVLVSGGKTGAQVEVTDEHSGFRAVPVLPPGEDTVLQMQIPGGNTYRNIRITALSPGLVFYGIQTRDKQPFLPHAGFDHSDLPPP